MYLTEPKKLDIGDNKPLLKSKSIFEENEDKEVLTTELIIEDDEIKKLWKKEENNKNYLT